MLSLWYVLDIQLAISDHTVVNCVLCHPFSCQDQGTNFLNYKAHGWLLPWTLPLAQGNWPIQGYTLSLQVAHIHRLVETGVQWPSPFASEAGVQWPTPFASIWKCFEGHSHTRVSHRVSWGFCCDCVAVHFLLLPKPASFTSSQVLFPGPLPNELPVYKSLSQSLVSQET